MLPVAFRLAASSDLPTAFCPLARLLLLPGDAIVTMAASLESRGRMEHLTGSVTRLIFRNPENTYTVLRLAPDKAVRLKVNAMAETALGGDHGAPRQASFIEDDDLPTLVTVVGDFANVEVGQQLWVMGEWVEHPFHGRQFKAEKWKVHLPTSLAGIQTYLASGLVRGIGPTLANAIVDTFQDKTFDIIDREPHRLLEVPGIGESRVRVITEVWREHSAVRALMTYLQGQDLAPNLGVKILKALGPDALELVQADPYRLTEIRGIDFHTADQIAAPTGRPVDAPERLAAGVRWAMEEMVARGHTYVPRAQLVDAAARLLEVEPALAASSLDDLAAAGQHLVQETALPDLAADQPTYTAELYRLEVETAQRLSRLARHPVSALATLQTELSDEQIRWAASVAGQTHLSAEQRQAVRSAVEHKLSLITGGPGTGKTICLRSLVALLELFHYRCVLVSPTGRSAKRLAEATGHAAATIHKLLKYTGHTFSDDEIEADVVIVDEASMLDLPLTRQLLSVLPPNAHLVLVGDVDQLPAVGPGMVLRDVIASGLAAVTRLTHIFRQAQSSLIVTNAHRINQGEPLLTPQRDCDFYLFATNNASEAADLVVDIVSRRIPEQFGASLGLADPVRDVQVLAPMYRGRAGIDRLNGRLQAVLNPPAPDKAERPLTRCVFRVGDKVMVTRNDYDRDVSNGEIGSVVELNEAEQRMRVDLDGRLITYDWLDTEDLAHAYAISIHKAQGSEYPAVVIPLLTEHTIMLYRQLLYTAVTRARRLCVLVGSRRAIDLAIEINRAPSRYSALAERLKLE
jgi:exodeoxyribonuclease V alpha subunit